LPSADDVRRRLVAAVHEGGISGRQFEQGDFRGAERYRGIGLQFRFDAKPMRKLDHMVRADLHHQLGSNGVQRVGKRMGYGHRAAVFLVIVLRRPVADPDRCVVAGRIGANAGLERCRIHEGLEGRTGLALRLDCAVELALGIVFAADQRARELAWAWLHRNGR